MTPAATPAPLTLRTLPPLIPCGEATELQPLAVIERDDAHAWLQWDMATAMQDFDPAPVGVEG